MANTYTQIYIQIMFAVEGRQNLIQPEHNDELQKYITGVVSGQGQKLIAINNMPDHVHMLISIPPKMSVAAVMGFMKGKSAIHLARVYAGRRRSFIGQHFWARGYWVLTVGRDEESVRRYIREQEKEDLRLDQLELKSL